MRFSPFVHLHNHSDFSLLSGAMTLQGMLDRAVELRQPAIAITDYGNLFGAIEFYSKAMRLGIKPILGCEFYLCDDYTKRVSEGPRAPRYPQVVLLARNNHGWQNLMKLASIGHLEGFYYKPRIDKNLLRKYGTGLIALTSGWNGEIEQLLQKGNEGQARSVAREYREIFHDDGFFIELQRHPGLAGQENVNRQLIELAHELDIPLVATNNAHFLNREDFHAFEAMLALQQNRTVHDDVSGHFTPECYLKSYDEMEALFEDVPEALENSVHIANRCNVDLQFGNYQLPDFQAPDGMELKEYIRELSREGLDGRWPTILANRPEAVRDEYEKRLEFELDVIEHMGFPGYFLIVSDFIMWAKRHGIPVGPGRGSGAGSLVAYVLGITNLDPIRYGLLFERFLNPERISMPDFDIDFCMSRREEVIHYVTEKYGEDKVAQIITFGSMKSKAVIRDMGRVLGMELGQVNTIAKLIPNDLKMTLDKALADEPRLAKMVRDDDEVARLFELAHRLEGMHRNAGTHAAGVIIGRDPLVETAPLFKVSGGEGQVVQWDMLNAEKMGLVKFDFLGLKTLTVIDLACKMIRKHHGYESFDIETIPLDDSDTFRLMQRGQTGAVFQVESSGMRDLLTRLKPDCFEDVIALVALYRPGPLESGMVDTFIECKHGRQEIVYQVPQLKPILQETNGVILYQEQVMQIAQVLAGYTLGQADMLRRAMGKKKPEEMAKQRKIFMQGAEKQKVPAARAEQIFDLMEKFAGYGFNKSHSAAYALISYQTAYLKTHFPQTFMAATLSCDMGTTDKVVTLINDCRSMDIEVLPPDINASNWEFIPEGNTIRYGLGAIKGVGKAAIRALVETREQSGPFTTFEDMIIRLPERTMNKRICEALIKAGAMHAVVPHVHAGLVGITEALNEALRRRKEHLSQQSALFEVVESGGDGYGLFPDVPEWSQGECLQVEREVLGFYLTGHPLEEYLANTSGLGDLNLSQLSEVADQSNVVIPVGVSSIREHKGGRGTMAFVQVEDLFGRAEAICFAKLYEGSRDSWNADQPLLLAARVDATKDEPALIVEAVTLLDEIFPSLVAMVRVESSSIAWDASIISEIEALKREKPGDVRFQFHVRLPDGSIAELESKPLLCWDHDVESWLKERFGPESVHVRCRPWKPEINGGGRKSWKNGK
ncbi:MAG: DNA polymerase III subunit alpha [Mariprofundaceae bacterium]|nr:DNA polymerase III subunit alpha [Mariprofundaceae bacterium]